uniref:Uncharacterized protein n=1 Tax=Knipowitschia caucasica TaxID=637954 RepID=A0AAV2MHL0_KNICA
MHLIDRYMLIPLSVLKGVCWWGAMGSICRCQRGKQGTDGAQGCQSQVPDRDGHQQPDFNSHQCPARPTRQHQDYVLKFHRGNGKSRSSILDFNTYIKAVSWMDKFNGGGGLVDMVLASAGSDRGGLQQGELRVTRLSATRAIPT